MKRSYECFTMGKDKNAAAVYLIGDADEAREAASLLPDKNGAIISVSGADWEKDLSPWPAEKAFRKGTDFAGGAAEWLAGLVSELADAEKSFGLEPSARGIAGYSLAGLFSIYALYNCSAFTRAASVSGSLWYDGFADYAASRPTAVQPQKVYFSLGDAEKNTRSRMSSVEEDTRAIFGTFESRGAQCVFELNPGGHFSDVPRRLARGIGWIL